MSFDRSETDILRHYDRNFVWHPFTPMLEYCREDVPIIVEAEGFHLIDSDGRAYLDGTSSLWCNVHGHRVPEIDEAIAAQLNRVSHSTLLGLANGPSVELAHQLVSIVPAGLSKVFYSDSGATAVEVALKMAFQFHRQKPHPEARDLFVSLSGAYHGDTMGAVSVGGVDLFHSVYESLLFPTLKVPSPVTYRVPQGHDADSYLQFCVDELDKTLRKHHSRIAAFVIEPLVQGASGMLVHPPGYLRRVRELTNQFDIPLIADEVAVGFGRTGTMFACEQEDVAPDILCLAKGLTGGYLPLAATLCTNEIYDAFVAPPEQYRTFFHGHTFTGNPLGCVAALASLRLFERNDVLGNVQRNGDWLRDRLQEFKRCPQVGDIRQCGTMVGIELVSDMESQARFPTAWRVGHRITKAARKRGLITRPLGDILVIMPAPAMPLRTLEELVDILEESMLDVLRHLPPEDDF